ncbi:MAG: segregation and condensation protein A [Burkholderiales bacterium]
MSEAAAPPIARIYGDLLHEMPSDLFIPPEALEVFLETFEGPLDLLLYLIRKHNLDVLDVPMAQLTRQYMDYVEMMRIGQLDLAAEYLLMAAWLTEIKSRMLLPRKQDAIEDETDPRAELTRRLLEYEQMKLAAQRLDRLPQVGRDFLPAQAWLEKVAVERLPQVDAADLKQAWQIIIGRTKVNQHHKIGREELSVREHMARILRYLLDKEFVEFSELFSVEQGIPELVVTFLAILELARESLVQISQQEAFASIYVRRIEVGVDA